MLFLYPFLLLFFLLVLFVVVVVCVIFCVHAALFSTPLQAMGPDVGSVAMRLLLPAGENDLTAVDDVPGALDDNTLHINIISVDLVV